MSQDTDYSSSTTAEKSNPYNNEKSHHYNASSSPEILPGSIQDLSFPSSSEEEGEEVFSPTAPVNFRTLSWPRASILFLKIIFATGVLSIPTAMVSLGAVGGALNVVGWGAFNTYTAVIQGNFRNRHRGCHSIADMAYEVGGTWVREVVGALFVGAYVLCAGSGIIGVSVGLNALSHHATCTVYFALVATLIIILTASIRKFQNLTYLTWAGFLSIFTAVLIVVIAVTTLDRPAAAPPRQQGEAEEEKFDLGFYPLPSQVTFASGVVASTTIFVSFAGTSAFLPVISEMRRPDEYRKALYLCMSLVTAAYLSLSMVMYRWAEKWVASPSLGSAGQTVKMIAYGIGLLGLVVSACLYLHVAAKYLFVRILRGSGHLERNSWVHWATWLGLTFGLGVVAFVLAEAIPIFNFLLALTGSVCFAPLAISLPGWLWLHDHREYRTGSFGQKVLYAAHALLLPLGAFFFVAGTYGVIKEIINAYANGQIGSAFSCADNSGST